MRPEMITKTILGLGFCAILVQIFFGGLLSSRETECSNCFFESFGLQADFCAHFCTDIWCADSCADFWCEDFPQTFCFDVLALKKTGVPESRKHAHKISGRICGVPVALPGGYLFHLRFLEQTARHTITARPTHSRRACERSLWHLWAERHACICSKTFQNKNLRKKSLCEPLAFNNSETVPKHLFCVTVVRAIGTLIPR